MISNLELTDRKPSGYMNTYLPIRPLTNISWHPKVQGVMVVHTTSIDVIHTLLKIRAALYKKLTRVDIACFLDDMKSTLRVAKIDGKYLKIKVYIMNADVFETNEL